MTRHKSMVIIITLLCVILVGVNNLWANNAGQVYLNSTTAMSDLDESSKNQELTTPIQVNTGDQGLAAYSFIIRYNSEVLVVNNTRGNSGVTASSGGFVSAVNATEKGVLRINGFDSRGSLQGLTDLFDVHWKVIGEGSPDFLLQINTLVDSKTAQVGTPRAVVKQNLPTNFTLFQNFPNPFNPETHISYHLAEDAKVTLEIYDTIGNKVRTIVKGGQKGGATHEIVWNSLNDSGQKVASGVYLYRIKAAGANQVFTYTRKMLLLK